ncbi:hypothetical protein BH09ACT12_BH09ACT12_06090 [soil metagenome]
MSRAVESPELKALREFHRLVLLVNAEPNLDGLLRTAAQGVVDVIGFQDVAVHLLTACGDFEAVTILGPRHDEFIGSRNELEMFLTELAAGEIWGQLCFVAEGRRRQFAGNGAPTPNAAPGDSWLADDALYAPLHAPSGDLLGILSVGLPHDGRRPGPVRRKLLEMYAVQIGLAISHARERERLNERLRLTAATRAVLQNAAASDGLDDILESSVGPLQEGFRGERAWITLFADPGGAWGSVNYPERLVAELQAAAVTGHGSEFPEVDAERVLAGAHALAQDRWSEQNTLVVCSRSPDSTTGVLTDRVRLRLHEWLLEIDSEQFVLVPLGVGDQCLGYFGINRDGGCVWTDAEEQAALDLGRELGRVIASVRMRAREHELMARLEDLDTYKSRVVTTIIHELKNPLSVVMGNLELARDEPELTVRAHAAIARGARRMQGLVEDLLTLTRLREPVVELDRVTLDLSEIIVDVATLVADQAERAEVRLDLSAIEPDVKVRSDRSEVDRLVLNLLSNAIKYTSPGGSVSLSLTSNDRHVEFICADTGMGIASEDMSSIFDEFDRSSNPSARSKPGSGLGLSIVRRIVQRHGGSIEVVSQLGQGSRFVVRLPLV